MEEEEEEQQQQLLDIELDNPNNTTNNQTRSQKKRDICTKGCGRPSNVCLCSQIPSPPITTSTKIIILHHPHEFRHKLATVPILTKCLFNSHTIIGRRLSLGSSPLLDELYAASLHHPPPPHQAIFLFPGTETSPSTELNQWVSSNLEKVGTRNVVLIVFDGTWKHAKEMVKASLPFLSKFASQVCFSYDVEMDGDNVFDSELTLRKEPFSGCMSTIEAVARSLHVLEPRGGAEIEEKLISVLRVMAQFQAVHFKPLKPRSRLLGKTKEGRNGKDSTILDQ